MKRLLLVGLGAMLAFAAATLLALEGREVVVLRTFDRHGQVRETRIWIADDQEASYIEAANSDRPFLDDIAVNPVVEIQRHGTTQRRTATVLEQPTGHELIRRLLRERYGWADWWVGLLTDTSRSFGIRLEP